MDISQMLIQLKEFNFRLNNIITNVNATTTKAVFKLYKKEGGSSGLRFTEAEYEILFKLYLVPTCLGLRQQEYRL